MNEISPQPEVLDEQKRDQANVWLVNFMQGTLEDCRREVDKLQQKLSGTYWVIVTLSILMFAVGMGLIIAAAWKGYRSQGLSSEALTIGGLGLADLTGLYFFRPVEQIRKIMADMSQITVAINSHQTQISLRLLETDSERRASMGEAAEFIRKVAKHSLRTSDGTEQKAPEGWGR
jgi:hypothetical protein